jgi:hypothetical protein
VDCRNRLLPVKYDKSGNRYILHIGIIDCGVITDLGQQITMTLTTHAISRISPCQGFFEMSVKGSIGFRKSGEDGYYFVSWYIGKKQYKISRYKGLLCKHKNMAKSLLSCMRSDDENKVFSIEKYLYQTVDVIPFLNDWLDTQNHLSPATVKDYHNSIKNHLIPWFRFPCTSAIFSSKINGKIEYKARTW